MMVSAKERRIEERISDQIEKLREHLTDPERSRKQLDDYLRQTRNTVLQKD